MNTLILSGRLGRDPKEIQTRSGKAMCTCAVAMKLPAGEDEHTEWVNLIGFGQQAEHLARHKKGDNVFAMGRLELNKWTSRDGEEKQSFQVVIDQLRSVKPRPKGEKTKAQQQGEHISAQFDDAIPFG
jgi:single stranded DNA-binding protein